MTEKAQAYFSRIQPGGQPPLAQTDPEFVDRFASFAFDEVVNMPLTEGMEPNPNARYRNPNITLAELIQANRQN